MKIFISWSGQQSRIAASALKSFIPLILQRAIVFTSADDIDKGARWSGEISNFLQEASFGLICLTPDNIENPWLAFEAGAMSKAIDNTRVVPIALGLSLADITGPLAQFQVCSANKSGIHKLLRSINESTEQKIPDSILDQLFDAMWPELESQLHSISSQFSNVASKAREASKFSNDGLEFLANELIELKNRIKNLENKG